MTKSKTLLTYYILLSLCVTSVFLLIFVLSPSEQQSRLVDENSAVENATALFYLLTVAICTWLGIRSRRVVFLVLGVLAVFSFLDEVGFGLSYLPLTAPELFQRYPIDGIHDFLKIVAKESRRLLRKGNELPYYLLGLGGVFLLGGIVVFRLKIWKLILEAKKKHALSLLFFCAFVVFGVISQAIDVIESFPLVMQMVEELLELNASLVLGFCAISLWVE